MAPSSMYVKIEKEAPINVIVCSFSGDTLMSELLYQLYLVHLQRLKGSMVLRVKRTSISLEEINCLPRVSNGKL